MAYKLAPKFESVEKDMDEKSVSKVIESARTESSVARAISTIAGSYASPSAPLSAASREMNASATPSPAANVNAEVTSVISEVALE